MIQENTPAKVGLLELPSELYGLFSHTSNKRRICVYEVFKQSPHTAESYKV